MARKLATIQTVKFIKDIPGADFIGLASFESIGWEAIVKKDDFKVGEKCIFFEIDSVVPDIEAFAFLKGKRRISTMKMKGTLSQGLALPIILLGEVCSFAIYSANKDAEDGLDLTASLGVEQYEPPQAGQRGFSSGPPEGSAPFPFFLGVKKTDEERIQSNPALLEEIAGLPYSITGKLDGQSATFAFTKDQGLIVCSRNLWIQKEDNSSYWQVARILDLTIELSGLAIQGEICGPGIQGNKLGLSRLEFYVFNILNLDSKQYLTPDEVTKACAGLALVQVPVLEKKKCFKHTQASLLALAVGNYPGTNNPREGLVVRSAEGKTSFKVINTEFLIHYKNE